MNWFKLILGLMVSSICYSQEIKGQLTDSVKVDTHAFETYSLYLPSQYSPYNSSAIVFIFDPTGSGISGIKPFIEPAEKYNYILVCSNNAKNGPVQKNFDIANRLFEEIFGKYNLDPKQIYLAGFSGGSRFSTAVAVLTNQIQGVIACGSGFPDDIGYAPTEPAFTYAGVVGDRDMNYGEMSNNQVLLSKMKFTSDLFVFSGPHTWPSPVVLNQVFDWFEILSYKKGIKQASKDVIMSVYQDMYEHAIESEDILRREAILSRIVNTFGTFVETDSIMAKLMRLRNSEKFISEKKRLKDIFDQEELLIQKLTARFYSDYKTAEKVNYNWWSKEIAKLNKIELIDESRRKMAERLRTKLVELAYTRSRPEYFNVNDHQKQFCNRILKILHPGREEINP